MALQVYIAGAWTNYTAGTTALPQDSQLHFKDDAATHDAGALTIGPFKLPWRARDVHFGMDSVVTGGQTVTAGTMTLRALPLGSSTSATSLPAYESALSGAATPRSADDTNEFGTVSHPPTDFYIRLTGLTGTATAIKFFLLAQRDV